MTQNKKRNITVFANTLQVGGLERVTVNLANGLAAANNKVDLVLVSAEGDLLDHIQNQVRLINLDAGRVLTSIFSLRRYFSNNRPDVCISMGAHVNSIAGIVTQTLRRSPAFVCTHHSILRRMDSSPKRRALRYLLNYAYTQADQIVCVSHGVLNHVQQKFGLSANRSRVIYNPVIDESFFTRKKSHPDHKWFGPEADVPVILSVGRHAPEKDFQMLVDAFAIFREKHEGRLVILGDGPKRETLAAYTENIDVGGDIDLPGFVDDVYPYMQHADVFALSSESEGFGMVLVEAMGCCCPVVSTDCPSGPAEILEYGKYGPLVPVGNAERMADALTQTLDSPPDPETLLHRARDFSIKSSVDQYELLLDSIVS